MKKEITAKRKGRPIGSKNRISSKTLNFIQKNELKNDIDPPLFQNNNLMCKFESFQSSMNSNNSFAFKYNRRDKEKNAIVEISALLPLSIALRAKIDRLGVVRLAIAHLKLRRLIPKQILTFNQFQYYNSNNLIPQFCYPQEVQENFYYLKKKNESVEQLKQFAFNVFQTLSGFVMIIDYTGMIIYVSETAAVHLGLSQVDIIGIPIKEIIHPLDYETIQLELALNLSTEAVHIINSEIRITLRFQCGMARRNAKLSTTSGYKTIHFTGRILASNDCRFIGFGEPFVQYGLCEIRLTQEMFMFRATLSLQLIFIDPKILQLTGFTTSNLINCSLYNLIHADDLFFMQEAHLNVLKFNESICGYFRFFVNNGGWCWMRIKFTIRYSTNQSQEPNFIIGICSAIGGVEQQEIRTDIIQKNISFESYYENITYRNSYYTN